MGYGNNQGYPPQQQYNNNQFNNNQNVDWNPPPNQNQNQYGNNMQGNNQQYPPQQQYNNNNQQQYNNNPQQYSAYDMRPIVAQNNNNNNLQQHPAPNQIQQQYVQNNQNNNNWQPAPKQFNQHQQQYMNNDNAPNQQQMNKEWHNKPKTKVIQKDNRTITETTESGGGRGGSINIDHNAPSAPNSHFGPGNITSSGPFQPETEQQKFDYFRLKLYESSCCCLCSDGNEHSCSNLWIWSIFWLIIFIVNGLFNLIGSLQILFGDNRVYLSFNMLNIFLIILSITVNVFAWCGLFKLKPLTFLVQIIFFILFLLLVFGGLFVYELTIQYIVMNVLFIICDVWACFVFWRVYRWAKYFKAGGKYDPKMQVPP